MRFARNPLHQTMGPDLMGSGKLRDQGQLRREDNLEGVSSSGKHFRGWVNPAVCQRYAMAKSREELEERERCGGLTSKEAREKQAQALQEHRQWSHAKAIAYVSFHENPNQYFYRHVAPHEHQAMGPWTVGEHELLMQLVREYGVGDNWGLLASYIPQRTGYQCRNYYHKLMERGQVPGLVEVQVQRKKKMVPSKRPSAALLEAGKNPKKAATCVAVRELAKATCRGAPPPVKEGPVKAGGHLSGTVTRGSSIIRQEPGVSSISATSTPQTDPLSWSSLAEIGGAGDTTGEPGTRPHGAAGGESSSGRREGEGGSSRAPEAQQGAHTSPMRGCCIPNQDTTLGTTSSGLDNHTCHSQEGQEPPLRPWHEAPTNTPGAGEEPHLAVSSGPKGSETRDDPTLAESFRSTVRKINARLSSSGNLLLMPRLDELDDDLQDMVMTIVGANVQKVMPLALDMLTAFDQWLEVVQIPCAHDVAELLQAHVVQLVRYSQAVVRSLYWHKEDQKSESHFPEELEGGRHQVSSWVVKMARGLHSQEDGNRVLCTDGEMAVLSLLVDFHGLLSDMASNELQGTSQPRTLLTGHELLPLMERVVATACQEAGARPQLQSVLMTKIRRRVGVLREQCVKRSAGT